MNTIREPERAIPVVHETDIAVIGGSCTGVFAAVRAARLGMRVAIVEQQNCFGGMATAGAVNVWHSLHDTLHAKRIIGGLTSETMERLARRGAIMETGNSRKSYRLNTEELKIELDELVTENRIVPFLHTFYAAPILEGKQLRAVAIENKNGRQAIAARQFVDATGDGKLALDSGLPCAEPESLQPPTLCAKIAGLEALGDFDWQSAVREHGGEFGLKPDWGWGGAIPGLPNVQLRADTHVFDIDASNATHLTRGEIEGRRQVRALLDLIRAYGPPNASVALVDLAAALGVRETRRIAARYRLTGDDVLLGVRFPDAIANGSYPVDIHHADGPGITFRFLDGTERIVPERGAPPIAGRWRDPLAEDPTFYQIPFRCLAQDGVENLALAGRMLDADKIAFSAARVMVNMNQTGEAAGVACALAMRDGCAIADVDPRRLRETLAQGGSMIL